MVHRPPASSQPRARVCVIHVGGTIGMTRDETGSYRPQPGFLNQYMEQMPELLVDPKSLRDATDLFEASSFARRALGEAVVEHYTHFFRTEQAAYDQAVTDWERQRYFERI